VIRLGHKPGSAAATCSAIPDHNARWPGPVNSFHLRILQQQRATHGVSILKAGQRLEQAHGPVEGFFVFPACRLRIGDQPAARLHLKHASRPAG